MLSSKMKAYEGKENYVFISYAHKDADRVLPIMERLDSCGYRLWYDEGIAPGSEWPEDIARHLNGAAMVIAFVSPNSMASVNCRREINFALSKEKPFLSVILEPTEMPLGMELQLSAQQSVLRHNYVSEEPFLEKICACPGLSRCRKTEDNRVTEELVWTPELEATLATKQPEQKASGKKKPVLLIVGCAVLLVALLGLLLIPRGGSEDAVITVYAKLPSTWVPAYCWAWGDEGDVYDAWPGAELTKQDSWYTVQIPDWSTGIVISSGEYQSQDIPLQPDTDIWVVFYGNSYEYFYEDPATN